MTPAGEDPLVQVDRRKLEELVKQKTVFTFQEFEIIVGWPFLDAAPQSKRALAWEIIQMSKQNQGIIRDVAAAFPGTWVAYVGDIQPLPDSDGLDRFFGLDVQSRQSLRVVGSKKRR